MCVCEIVMTFIFINPTLISFIHNLLHKLFSQQYACACSPGYFLYVDSSFGNRNSMAELTTPFEFGPSPASCQIQFYYHMRGRGIGRLLVVLRESQEDTVLWEKVGDQGNNWVKGLVDLGRVSVNFRILFRATRTYSVQGDIAIDDISYINCNYPAPQAQCSANQFTCNRKSCVGVAQVCDFSDDCGDGSDEANCSGYPLRTDFEYSFGLWAQDSTDDFDWTRQQGSTSSDNTGPTRDHTRGTTKGHYAFIETSSPRVTGDKARLVSPIISATDNKGSCQLRMYSHMYGSSVGSLNIYTRQQGNGILKKIFSRTGNEGDQWVRVIVPLNEGNDFQILIEAVKGRSYTSDIAVDDISLTTGCSLSSNTILPTVSVPITSPSSPSPCGSQFSCDAGKYIPQSSVCDFVPDCNDGSDEAQCGTCDFETGLCGWRDTSTSIYSWTNISTTSATGLRPLIDSTFSSKGQGHYMTVSNGTGVTRDPARLVSPVLKETGASCHMSFFYYMNGAGSGQLSVYLQNSNDTGTQRMTRLWTTGLVGDGYSWKSYSVDIGQKAAGYQVVILSKPSSGSPFGIAIDDLRFQDCKPNTVLNTTNLDCSFEGGNFCSYFQSRNDDFDWKVTNLPTPSYSTGPSGDHTSGKGYYVYLETSTPQKPGDRAVLMSALQPAPTSDSCLLFWYNMFGENVETFNVYSVTDNSNYTLIWTKSSAQGNVWRQGEAKVKAGSKNYQIAFEGLVGSGYAGDIALDDISLRSGRCPLRPTCDFEIDQCSYTQLTLTDKFDWTRWSNGTNSHGTGPSVDHTTGNANGYYMYIEASGRHSGDNARMMSPKIMVPNTSVSHCVYFWFHMFGSHIGQLNLYARYGQGATKRIWNSDTMMRGDYWQQSRATINGSLGNFNVSIYLCECGDVY